MTYYVRVGEVPKKRHTLHRGADGKRLSEELFGEEGFAGASSLLYHRHSPSAIGGVESVAFEEAPLSPNQPLLPWHLRLGDLKEPTDPVTGRQLLLASSTMRLSFVRTAQSSDLYSPAGGDELFYIHRGEAELESVFGRLPVSAGDYVVIPASTIHRWVVLPRGEQLEALVVEARGHIEVPARYRNASGQMREGAPFSERDLRLPIGPLLRDGENVDVLVRTKHGWTQRRHRHHPFDVVAWDGALYPYALSIRDFEPIVGRIHQPPPVHQTFAGPGFVVCSFVPRLFDFDPDAIKVPYHHANVDSDEVLFYTSGEFMSRRGSGIEAGSLTLHPAGFVHGPQPGSVEAPMSETRTEETAVMIDSFESLQLSDTGRAIADASYVTSWTAT